MSLDAVAQPKRFGFRKYAEFVLIAMGLTAGAVIVVTLIGTLIRNPYPVHLGSVLQVVGFAMMIAIVISIPVIVIAFTVGYVGWCFILRWGGGWVLGALFSSACGTLVLAIISASFSGYFLSMGTVVNATQGLIAVLISFLTYYLFTAPIAVFSAWIRFRHG